MNIITYITVVYEISKLFFYYKLYLKSIVLLSCFQYNTICALILQRKVEVFLLPQSHIVIARQIYKNIDEKLNVKLDKNNLIYGSIKPDLPLHSSGIPHFKPQSFNYICNKIHELSLQPLCNNREFIKYISRQIGIVTHYIADYFCVPHNDRVTYKKHFLDHISYEASLHKEYKYHINSIDISKGLFKLDNTNLHSIKSLIDELHGIYRAKGESLKNDLESSIEASIITGLLIIHNSKSNLEYSIAA